jgi:uncharacterized protein
MERLVEIPDDFLCPIT